MRRKVTIDGKNYTIENNALLPRRYRHQFGRDLLVDMQKMVEAYHNSPETCSTEVLENVTWLMLKEAGEQVGENPEEWLAGIESPFAVYEAIGDVVDLWAQGKQTTSRPKKK